ncbi:MAG: peptidyl-tRNA hydrolase Pth2 [Candidatus Nanoarchaeia archaeon]|nr:peptidyl-tRNA hydrolase Pth2 [Candidatus Nanoarchaeia archaeon]
MYKQVILVCNNLKLPKGKLAAQVAHASVDAVLKQLSANSGREVVSSWRREGMKKVVLKVEDEKELYKYIQLAKDEKIPTSIITDAGKTVVAPGTTTCGAIGPFDEETIERITKDLSLM